MDEQSDKQTGALALYYRYWGKAAYDQTDELGCHLLPYHCLDVAAVGQRLLEKHHPLRKTLQRLTGLTEKDLHASLPTLLALHDLGKFSSSFQALRPDIAQAISPTATAAQEYDIRHDQLGYTFWQRVLKPRWQQTGLIPRTGRGGEGPHPIDTCMLAMTGHHGKPPSAKHIRHERYFSEADQQAAIAFIDDVLILFPCFTETLPKWDMQAARQASWWLAGFAVLCDWIGSNADFFAYNSSPASFEEYWKVAKQQAGTAIAKTELLTARPSHSIELSQLLNIKQDANPTPLQDLATTLTLGHQPQLFILEDVTGAGKTEAALLIAHRLMAAGLANGLYFGLPTMATANAMYDRVGNIYREFYESDAAPSLVLAHGARDLSDKFRQSLIPQSKHPEAGYPNEGVSPASIHCCEWLADNRKKALLAEIGIGTIDQALLSILPNKHQSLRLLGLSNKVLLVDEVHACDAYMLPLLERLLTAHAMAGGSAILLSATLPKAQRERLMRAFAEGTGKSKPSTDKTDYPLLTHFNGESVEEHALQTRSEVKRHVSVDFISQRDQIEQQLSQWIEQADCACWICNTVADAREVYSWLKSTHTEWQIDLFHARFCLADRITIENRVLQRFGKKGDHKQRAGQLLIATQVVEQSLDLDFDHLISDLAPIDLLIQRAGRLHRHRRDVKGNPINNHDQRMEPILTIHSPEWQEEPTPDWFKQAFPRAQAVYENHAQLWLGMKLLKEQNGFRMPEDARNLIEGVYGLEAEIPEGLQEIDATAEGNQKAQQGQGKLNRLHLEGGYSREHTNNWWDDADTPTRLGEETTQVWLAKWQDGELTPLHNASTFRWQQSSLTVRRAVTDACEHQVDIPADVLETCKTSLPAKGKWGLLITLVSLASDLWQGTTINQKGEKSPIYYSSEIGLMTDKEYTATQGTDL